MKNPRKHKMLVPFPPPPSFKDLTDQKYGGRSGIKILQRAERIARAIEGLGGPLMHPLTNRFCSPLAYRQAMAEEILKQQLKAKTMLGSRVARLQAKFS